MTARAMRRVLILFVPAILACSAVNHPQTGATSGVRNHAIESGRSISTALLRSENLPGLSVAVARDGQLMWSEGFGFADVENRVHVTAETRFRIGSISKAITSAAAALLHQSGKLDYDLEVQRYVPAFPRKPWPVSVRQLLDHQSGIRHYADESEVLTGRHCDDVNQALGSFAADTLLFQPGTRFSYSSYGYTLVSAVVQKASGTSFSDFVSRRLLAPFGMRSTSLESMTAPRPGIASFYVRVGDSFGNAPTIDTSCLWAAGGFLSTPEDLVRFGMGLLKGDILSQATVNELWTPARLVSGDVTGYGLGWFVRDAVSSDGRTFKTISHGGSSIGGRAALIIIPDSKIVVAVATNLNVGTDLYAFSTRIAGLFAPAYEQTSQEKASFNDKTDRYRRIEPRGDSRLDAGSAGDKDASRRGRLPH